MKLGFYYSPKYYLHLCSKYISNLPKYRDAIYFFISNSIIKFKEVVCEKMVFIALRFDLIINLCKNLSLLFTAHIGEQKLFFTSGSMNSAAKRYPYFLQSNAYAGKRCGHIIYTSAHSRKKVP